jgi:hypothetical protein
MPDLRGAFWVSGLEYVGHSWLTLALLVWCLT